MIDIRQGDCLELLKTLDDSSVSAVVTDPPYALTDIGRSLQTKGGSIDPRTGRVRSNKRRGGFMNKSWDASLPDKEVWQECLRVVKPGGFLLAFGSTRTWHRLACSIEDAGWYMFDTCLWLHGQGFPKGKACLKPSWEPILMYRKPAKKGTPLNVDACRVETNEKWSIPPGKGSDENWRLTNRLQLCNSHPLGRWPANLVHDGSPEVMEGFPETGQARRERTGIKGGENALFMSRGNGANATRIGTWPADAGGSAARFFYCAKSSQADRGEGNTHPTVKSTSLLRWLIRLVSQPGDTILDPFLGSGSTAVACIMEGRSCIGFEREAEYIAIANRRVADAESKSGLFAEV